MGVYQQSTTESAAVCAQVYLNLAKSRAYSFRLSVGEAPFMPMRQQQALFAQLGLTIINLESVHSYFISIGKRCEITMWILYYKDLLRRLSQLFT